MKSINKRRIKLPFHMPEIAGVVIGLLFICISCDLATFQDETITYYEIYDESITKYFESNPERFSILSDILDTTGLDHLFRTYGDYTFLAPTDSAFEAYFKEKGIFSYMDFQTEELTELLKYHIFNNPYVSGNFNSGIIESKTLSSDYMVSGPTADGTDIILNKSARIIIKDEILPNGIIHVIDKVLEKPENSIYDWLKENQADYSIFLEAVENTGLNQKFSKNDEGSDDFYACFITPDSKYIESNINSFADLAQLISPANDNYTDTANILWSFIGSHFTTDIISMSDAEEEHVFFGTIGKATTKFGLKPSSADVVLNYNTSNFPSGLDVDEFNSNNLVSNGIIHIMDTMFRVPDYFLRTNLIFLCADIPGLPYDSVKQISIEHTDAGTFTDEEHRYWPRANGPNHLPFERTNGWLTLNAPYSGFIKFDDHRNDEYNQPQDYIDGMNQPIFFGFEKCDDLLDITWKLPYIIPGKYKLFFVTKVGFERPAVRHYFDGEPIGGIYNLSAGALGFQSIYHGVVEINEGETEHYFREVMVTPGNGFHVAIKLEPVD
ncbi:MAG: fasciclin domain-containing protein [Bacteroidales bacterium]|nr:MAG: fasciclin domain-containing protein [Bacteroidales bacterium]